MATAFAISFDDEGWMDGWASTNFLLLIRSNPLGMGGIRWQEKMTLTTGYGKIPEIMSVPNQTDWNVGLDELEWNDWPSQIGANCDFSKFENLFDKLVLFKWTTEDAIPPPWIMEISLYPHRPGYQDQYGQNGKNYQGEIYVARLNDQNERNDDAAGQNGRENQLINLEAIDCGEAAANDFLKLKHFANSPTSSAFTWFINLPANSIHTWQEMERKFREQFYRIELEVSMVNLSRLYQRESETAESFLARFKRARNLCHMDVPEREFVKLAMSGLSYKLKKKFIGMKFGNLFELATRFWSALQALIEKETLKFRRRELRYEDRDHKVGLVGAHSEKFEYYVQYSKPDNYHKPRQQDVEDGIDDLLAETSSANDDDFLAKTSKAKTNDCMAGEISSSSDDDELL
ncbi:hypothetical protein FNV43_RR18994 [Rhamnella rubrinervis]|uniref:Retrotransposon gag domain-containing protein n=1 Tax=Rhamnella rubrinervis TaxID=2594499 RepID=A0A8K0E4T4_9ROSA|nr:hypothetical protein FNV43_RR18994 [Rhamnella rubrinervis]